MKLRLDIDQVIFINQVAQGVHSINELLSWYDALPKDQRFVVLKMIRDMIFNARQQPDDASEAIKRSGLKVTFTPCVLLARGANREQLNKLIDLPEEEQAKTLVLLLSLFQVADDRRRSQEADGMERHWWHRDLSDPDVLSEVHHLYKAGRL